MTELEQKGIVLAVEGQVAEVEFSHAAPAVHDILVLENDPGVTMEVFSSSRANSSLKRGHASSRLAMRTFI